MLAMKGSRELCLFKGEKNTRNGVIVECLWNKNDRKVHTIADFTTHTCVYSLRTCFKTRQDPETRSQFYKDERPYEVFENVNFEADANNLVTQKIARNQKKWECFNMGNNVFVVRDVCVFSRSNPRQCYSELAGGLVPYNEDVLPKVLLENVPFDCFLQFNFTPSGNLDLEHPRIFPLTYKVHSLEQVNPERFGLCYKAPWFKLAQPAYQVNDPFMANINAERENNLPGIKAFALTGNMIYVPERPRWKISLAFNKINSLLKNNAAEIKPHMALTVDVRFNDVLNRYIVYDATIRPGNELQATLTPDYFHKAALSPLDDCPGYFTYRDYGLIFDKYGQMVQFYSGNSNSKVVADFGYVDPDERAYTALEVHRVYESSEVDLKQETYQGIYIGNNEFYCPLIHFLILRAPYGVDHSLGSWYDVTIVEVDQDAGIADVEATIIPTYDRYLYKMIGDQPEFLVDVALRNVVSNRLLFNARLGPIGITEGELANADKMKAMAIKFPLPKELREDRPQLRPMVTRPFKTYDLGKSVGGYK